MAKEYIERETLIAEYDRTHIGAPGGARKLMVDAPAVDAVEVVRCKACRYFDVIIDCCTNELAMHSCYEDGFCSYGERKEK